LFIGKWNMVFHSRYKIKIMEENSLEYLSDDVQEILGTPPNWVLTAGTWVITLVVLLLGAVGWFFKYPDKVKCEIALTTLEPPMPVYVPKSGYLSEILVEEKQAVKKGKILAVLSNQANWEDVLFLEKEVDDLQQFNVSSIENYIPTKGLDVGEILPDYAGLLQVFEEYSFAKSSKYDLAGVRELNNQVEAKKKSIKNLESLKINTRKELELAIKDKRVAAKVYGDTVGNPKLMEPLFEARSKELQKQKELKNIDLNIAGINENINELKYRVLQLKMQAKEGNNSKFTLLKQSLSNLKAAINEWKNKYLLVAPIDGIVTFYNFKKEQQYVEKGEQVMAIVPLQEEEAYVGQVILPIRGSGKVKTGQDVIIKFERYPFQEFGHVKGRVKAISSLPKNDAYSLEVELVNGLTTSFGKELEFRQQMSGQAEIITEDRRFITRLFERLWSVFF